MHATIRALRKDALAAYRVAVASVQPRRLIQSAVHHTQNRVEVRGLLLPRAGGRKVVLAAGKAGPGLADAWLELAPDWRDEVWVLAPSSIEIPPNLDQVATVLRGSHPYPNAEGEASTRRILDLASSLDENDLLLVLLSGGGSALLSAPQAPLQLGDIQLVTRLLLRAGAPINAANTVRRQLLAAGGGGLARAAFPARVVTLIVSDVIGDPLPDIASGPTVRSPTDATHALAVLDRYALRDQVPDSVLRFLDSKISHPDDHPEQWVQRCQTRILGNNSTAASAAAAELDRAGYQTLIAPTPLTGEAAARGRQLGALTRAITSKAPFALVLGGETTVTVRGSGHGGRNQELALAAAPELEDAGPRVLLAAGTDGIDGLSDNAGALIDPTTVSRLRRSGVDPCSALAHNDTASAHSASGDAIVTGPSGTNVCDLTLILVAG